MAQIKMLDVTDLSSYLFCPRKYYLQKIKGLKQPPSKEMIEGKIRHSVLEDFSNKEQGIVESLEPANKEKIISIYQQVLLQLINFNFQKNRNLIFAFKISSEQLQVKIINAMNNDFFLRAESVEQGIKKGFLGKELWSNLSPKYLSEVRLISENLGLKGRADRIMFHETEIIPFELKTREVEKVYESDQIQLTAYAMLLEEIYKKPIKIGILEAGNKKHEVIITEQLKSRVLDLIKEVREISDNPKFPFNFAKCQKCSFKNECDELK